MERKTFLKSIGAEGQEKSAELIEAERTANELGNQFCEAGLDIIQKLLQNINDAELASRFKTDVDVERLIEDAEPGETSRLKEQALRNGGQPELKKLQLKSEALGIQSDLFSLVDRLKRVVMDLEASKIE